LRRDGYRVAIVDIQERLSASAEEQLGAGDGWWYFTADVGDERQIQDVEQAIAGTAGEITALVNNAGIFPRHEAATLPLDQWNEVLRVNLTGTFICSQVLGQAMRRNRAGAIVTTASGRAFMGGPRSAAYSASKSGIVGLTRALAFEWAPLGVRVNCVVPGIADTAQPRIELSDEELYAAAQHIPLGRIGQPADIAAAVAFLLSDDASYITGQTLAVNGGAAMI
jgi:NAD(P)-dependent dehydrogenase (short-subunit alcohol dehydrogenase family)